MRWSSFWFSWSTGGRHRFHKGCSFFFFFQLCVPHSTCGSFSFSASFWGGAALFLTYVGIFFGIRRKAQDMHPSIFVGIFADGPDDLCCEKQEKKKKIAHRRETFCAAPVCRAEMRAGRPSWWKLKLSGCRREHILSKRCAYPADNQNISKVVHRDRQISASDGRDRSSPKTKLTGTQMRMARAGSKYRRCQRLKMSWCRLRTHSSTRLH